MRRRVLPPLVLAAALLAGPALAGVGYSVIVESPLPDAEGAFVLRGNVVVGARAEGGVGGADFAAFHGHPETGGKWSDAERTTMNRFEEARFLGSDPWQTWRYLNGPYDLEVRIWGEVPEYDPENANTFARKVVKVVVDNPPDAPRPKAVTGARSVRLSWRPVWSSDRGDFLGYRIWVVRGPRCPDNPEAYSFAGDATGTTWTRLGFEPGRYCFRVTAARESELTGLLDSAFSPPVKARVLASAPASGGAGVFGGRSEPPRKASVNVPTRKRKQGTFKKRLPYRPKVVQVPAAGAVDEGDVVVATDPLTRTSSEEASHRVAAGLLLLAVAIHLRLFLRSPARATPPTPD